MVSQILTRGSFVTMRATDQRGFTLIEVLITLLIMSIGLLGLAGLQMTGLKLNDSAERRSQATILAYDILDRMRANRAAAEIGAYNISTSTTPAAASCAGSSSDCNATAMKNYDLYEWREALAQRLPGGTGEIATSGATPPAVTIKVQWNDEKAEREAVGNRSGAAPTTQELQIKAVL